MTEIENVRLRNRSSRMIGSERAAPTSRNRTPTMAAEQDQPADPRIGPLECGRLLLRPTRNGAMAPVNSAAPT